MSNELDIEISNGVKLVILIEVEQGKAQQQIDLYQKIKPLVLEEEGCFQYELNRVSGSDVKFVLIECWESQKHLDLHGKSTHMIEADTISTSFRAAPVTVLQLTHLDKH